MLGKLARNDSDVYDCCVFILGIVKEHGREHYLLKLMQDGKRGKSEVTFYEAIFELDDTQHNEAQQKALTGLRDLVPKYFGKRVINIANRGM